MDYLTTLYHRCKTKFASSLMISHTMSWRYHPFLSISECCTIGNVHTSEIDSEIMESYSRRNGAAGHLLSIFFSTERSLSA